jgi:hypothetical protein
MAAQGRTGGDGRMTTKVGTYAVVCNDYSKDGFLSREMAEAWIKSVEDFGHCRHEHRVEIVKR